MKSEKWIGAMQEGIHFLCPGCDIPHAVTTSGKGWTFNGNLEAPTLVPSVLVTWTDYETGQGIENRCHSFVTGGRIKFLEDCTHALAGKTVELPDLGRWAS